MQVLVAFDFPDIDDPDSQEASMAVDTITMDTETWGKHYTTTLNLTCEVFVADVDQ